MKTCRVFISIALVLSSSGAAAAEPSDAQRAEALKRFNEGIESSSHGDYEAARLRFLQALTIFPDRPSVLWNLGVAEMKTHHPVEATRHLRAFLQLPPATNADRAKARPYLDEAARETGHVVLTVDPGAVIRLDDSAFEEAPSEPLDVEPGPHVLEAKVGTKAKWSTVSPKAGETVTADLRLPASTTAPEPTPAEGARAPTAAASASAPAAAPEPQIAPVPPVAPEKTGPSPVTRIVVTSALGAAAVAGVVTGAVFLANASSEGNTGAAVVSSPPPGGCGAGSSDPACASGHQAAENEASDKSIAAGMFLAGGLLAGGAVASWLLLAPRSDRSGVGLAPAVSPAGAGCVISGRF